MLEAIRSGVIPFQDHLDQCEECRNLFAVLSRVTTEAELAASEPSRHSVYRHRAIALIDQSRHPRRQIAGAVVFDSWSHLSNVQVRDAVLEGERRLRLKAGRYVVELVADRQLDTWEFTARVYAGTAVTSEFILQIGRRKLFAEAQQCYFWTAKHPPRRVRLLSPDVGVDFGELSW